MWPRSTWTAVVYSQPWACIGGLLRRHEQGDAQQQAMTRVPSIFQSGPSALAPAAGFSAAQPETSSTARPRPTNPGDFMMIPSAFLGAPGKSPSPGCPGDGINAATGINEK